MTHFDFSDINIWAIVVASILNMVIGFLWYSKALFGKPWMAALGFKVEELNPSPWIFVLAFLMGAIIATFMALFLQGINSAVHGLAYGAILALVFVIPTLITHYLYEQRTGKFMLIVAGHELLVFMVFGALIGGWQ